MKVVGIVAEFNPMHTGHKYLIDEAKKITKADVAICIMSGNFTQAGNIALKNKFNRAKIAIENGFDVVIELPTIYATASAQFFARGAIEILHKLGCIDYLAFGSETADTDELYTIANTILNNEEDIWKKTSEVFKSGISFAKAHEQATSEYLTPEQIEVSSKSNNILAIEYIKNLIRLKSNINPIAIKRIENDNVVSATKIRELVSQSNIDEASKYSLDTLTNTVTNDKMLDILKYNIISKDIDYLASINEVTEGIENVLVKKVSNGINYDEFIQEIKSKRYQLSKIKRILVNILLDITKEEFNTLSNSHYAHILCVNQDKKSEILSMLNANTTIPVITSLNEKVLSSLDEINRKSLELDIKANNIYNILCGEKINIDYTNKI